MNEKSSGHRRDGAATLSLSEDKLSLDITLYPAIGEGNILTREVVENLLSSEGIVFGVDWEAVSEGIFECNTENKRVSVPKAAKGKLPVPSLPEHILLEEKLTTGAPLDTESLTVDYKTLSPYTFVRKNERLGTIAKVREGQPGMNVLGEEIPAGRETVALYTPGENVVVGEDEVTAACDGNLELKDTKFFITQALLVKGDVDYHTGNIFFPGDISVEGTVREGFRVAAGGSIHCAGVVEASHVSAKQDIFVGLGILGKKRGLVKAGGEIRAKFIENCTVKAKGALIISDSILNSRIYTLDRVDMGDKGRILGGAIYAVNGIKAFRIGNAAMQVTHIQCGVNFVAQDKLEEVKKRHTELFLKLQKAHELLEKPEYKNSRAQLESLELRLTEALSQVTAAMNLLLEKINGNEDADIIVKDTVYPGVTIEICHVNYLVISPMKKVRFYLDKGRGKIMNDAST